MKLLSKSIQIIVFMVFANTYSVYAQLGFCEGNSGDAIFTETFGTGTTYGPPLPAGTTTYNFISNSGPQDGQYTIGSNTFSYGWNLPSDRTPGDTNGKCLIVNASFTPGEFYKTSVSGLCENTTYEFSAWVINILPSSGCGGSGIPVNVKFEIWDSTDTNLLAFGDTGNIFGSPTPNWQQYGLVFQTLPSQTSVILKMLNNGVGGCGNDLAIDDIVFKSCGDRVVLENTNGSTNIEACEDEMINSVLLSAIPDFSVFSSHAFQWQVSSDEITWNDISGATTNTYNAPAPVGTFYYRVKFAEVAANIQNSSCNSLSDVFEVTINALETPTFNAVGPICNGDTLAALPTTSTNNITGTWSPALDNTSTTTYTFTPNAGQCATMQTLTISVNQPLIPTFDPVAPICNGDTLAALPTTSTNNISGTWSPTLNNTVTTTYTFTPNTVECATTQTLTISVNQPISPTFNTVTPICNGDTLADLPTTSTNNITGTWSPALNNTTTTTYTFTPTAGECATSQTLTIIVNQPLEPTFNAVAPICSGENLAPLTTTSINNITGTWSPALNNTTTTTYTFTPTAGQCATTQSLTITVDAIATPTFDAVLPICTGETLAPLPSISTNGISGTWSPALNNTTTTTYTFTPGADQCATTQTLTIVVNQSIAPTFNPVPAICNGQTIAPLPTTSTNNISGTWSPALNNTTTTTYTFTPDQGQCPNTATLTIVVNQLPVFDLEDTYFLCVDTNGTELFASPISIDTNLSTADYLFEWYNSGGVVVGMNASYLATAEGVYSVVVTDLITGCQSEDSTSVTLSSPPIVQAMVTSDSFSINNTIEVSATGMGNYEYSLGNGAWQDNPNFTNVSAGNHTVTARDKNGCGFASVNICVIGYPKFITPNGDGYNDTWNIKGADCLVNAQIYIFDRYGKFLKELSLNNTGWNGTFNGELLPTNDYWFVIRYIETNSTESKEFKGHFTLKR